MKGTQLWQEAGSPIIRGRSRRQRPFWQPWLGAFAVSQVLVSAATFALMTRGAVASPALNEAATRSLALVPVTLVGSAAGVYIARRVGWRATWVGGVLVGVVGAVLAAWFLGWHL